MIRKISALFRSFHQRAAPILLLSIWLVGGLPYPSHRRTSLPDLPRHGEWPPAPASTSYPIHYTAQSGDTLAAIARRFNVNPDEITSYEPFSLTGLLVPGQPMLIMHSPVVLKPSAPLMPDGEVVYGPSTVGFSLGDYLKQSGGFLGSYQEYLRSSHNTPAAEIIDRVALENSINPRLMLGLLEYECHCTFQSPADPLRGGYFLDYPQSSGLYGQLGWMSDLLSQGYYGWRSGALAEFILPGGEKFRPSPAANAGSVALQYYFARRLAARTDETGKPVSTRADWERAVDPEHGFLALYRRMFGDPWQRAARFGPLFNGTEKQPLLSLPFPATKQWSLSSGPHKAWETEGALAALDFAPQVNNFGCVKSSAWVTAVASGKVVRSAYGVVVQDLNRTPQNPGLLSFADYSDGLEQTGWAVIYLHIREEDRVPEGFYLQTGDRVGHPSCEGGPATGTHLHIARKYNGEWIAADGPLSFVMDGWTAHASALPYQGTLTRGDAIVVAGTNASPESMINRPVLTTTLSAGYEITQGQDHEYETTP